MKWLDSVIEVVGVSLGRFTETVEDTGTWCAMFHGIMKRQT